MNIWLKKYNSVINYSHVVPNPEDLCSSPDHKLRYFWWNPRAFWLSIDRKGPTTSKAQKGSKNIDKIVHVPTSNFKNAIACT